MAQTVPKVFCLSIHLPYAFNTVTSIPVRKEGILIASRNGTNSKKVSLTSHSWMLVKVLKIKKVVMHTSRKLMA